MIRLTLILLFFTCNLFSQEIAGTVYFENSPVAKVNILVENSSVKTQSDENGKFVLKVKKGDIISFSYEEMQIERFLVENFDPIKIRLEPKINELEEIKLTTSKNKINKPKSIKSAFGKISTRGAGYAVQSFSAKDIQNSTVDLPQALVGKVPNYTLTPRGVILRGRGFQTGYAIWDIDGIVFEGLPPYVNPEDVESINIIANPAGTLQYGKRGRGGVIVVNTVNHPSSKKNRIAYPKLNFFQQKNIELPYKEKELSEVIKRVQANKDSLRLLAFVYGNRGNSKLALKLNRLLLANDSDNIRSYRDVAESLTQIEKKNKAWNVYKTFLNTKGDHLDETSFDIIFHDMERLYHAFNMKRDLENAFESKKTSPKHYENETRIIFEWTVPNETLSIEVVNPKNVSVNFQLGNSFIKNASIEDVFIDETIKGNWILNLSISEVGELNGYLKVTIYKNWISPNKIPPESKIFLLSKELSGAKYKLLDLKI